MRDVKGGLSIQGHRALAEHIRRMRMEAQAVRDTIRSQAGSATTAYVASARILSALTNLANALTHELVEHADALSMEAIRTFYADAPEAPRPGAEALNGGAPV